MAQSTPTPSDILDLEANLALYDPTRYPGVTFVSTNSERSWTSNGTVWVPNFGGAIPASFYGNGSDGDLNILAAIPPLTGDVNADHLVVGPLGEIPTNGWKIYARTSIVIQAGGKVTNNGVAGVGNAGGGQTGSGTIVAEGQAGGKGGVVGAGVAGSGIVDALVVPIGGDGGNGGTAPINVAGAGGVATTKPAAGGFNSALYALTLTPSGQVAVPTAVIGAGRGGGGGGSDAGGQGGGGGGGGGVVFMASPSITHGGIIEAKGGAGGNAVAAGDQGGGGGGGGGVVILVHEGPLLGAGTVDTTGGAGGIPQGAGTIGAVGSNGDYANLDIA